MKEIQRKTKREIKMTHVKKMYAKSVSGGVVLDGCDGGTIKIETTSGSITIEIEALKKN